MTEIIATIWLSSGLAFWIGMLRHSGPPAHWTSSIRRDGWDVVLMLHLPMSLLAGPLGWGLLWWTRRG